MFGLDRAWWIIPVILVIVLVIWGPGKMPDVGAGLGHAIREFRDAVSGVHGSMADTAQVASSGARPAEPPVSSPAPSEQTPAMAPDNTRLR